MKRPLRNLAIVIGIAGIGAIWLAIRWDYIRIRPADRAVEQDAVYEAVMRYATQSYESTRKPLRFDSRVESAGQNGISYSQCLASRRRNVFPTNSLKPQYDTFADRLCRFVTHRPYDFSIHAETNNDFGEQYCALGPLSQTFRTDRPKEFVDALQLYALEEKIEKATGELVPNPEFYCLYSLSRVGFDPKFREAMVSWSMCGRGNLFVLKKSGGRWSVVGSLATRVV
jgi:hypothetical protein